MKGLAFVGLGLGVGLGLLSNHGDCLFSPPMSFSRCTFLVPGKYCLGGGGGIVSALTTSAYNKRTKHCKTNHAAWRCILSTQSSSRFIYFFGEGGELFYSASFFSFDSYCVGCWTKAPCGRQEREVFAYIPTLFCQISCEEFHFPRVVCLPRNTVC